jgi:hypothetical protein
MKKILIMTVVLSLFTGCTIVKTQLRDKVLPMAEEKIPEMVVEELADMVKDGELTEKQAEKLKEFAFKLLIRLDEKAKIILSE